MSTAVSPGDVAAAPAAPLRARLLFSLRSPNTLASLVYLGYCILTVVIETAAQPKADRDLERVVDNVMPNVGVNAADDYDAYYAYYDAAVRASDYVPDLAAVNRLWVVSALWHLVNAVQYYFVWPMWRDPATGRRPFSVFPVYFEAFPELCNVAEASLYVSTAFMYAQEVTYGPRAYLDAATFRIHHLELAAAVLELVAAFAWTVVWWRMHPRTRGRGLTLDDPEFTALVLLVLGSFCYLAYNVKVELDSKLYGDPEFSKLYSAGDWLYLVGAVFYVLAALRDDNWFASFHVFGALAQRAGFKLAPESLDDGDAGAAATAAAASAAAGADGAAKPPPPAAASAGASEEASGTATRLVVRSVAP